MDYYARLDLKPHEIETLKQLANKAGLPSIDMYIAQKMRDLLATRGKPNQMEIQA